MAISLDELAAVALDGTVGPITLAVGASALAVALAAGTARPLGRIAATSVLAVERIGQLRPLGVVGAVRRGWTSLVAEARAEYEASRRPRDAVVAPPVVLAAADRADRTSDSMVVSESPHGSPADEGHAAGRVRDGRGRFVRRSKNGAQPE